MKLADKPCYPIFNDNGYCSHLENNDALMGAKGLTFRERLIIALASNYWMFEPSASKEPEKRIIDTADAIIKRMENQDK